MEENEWKIAFYTCYRFFEWAVISFSLTNIPTTLQQFMSNIFSDLLDICIVVYLNNILIYLNNMS